MIQLENKTIVAVVAVIILIGASVGVALILNGPNDKNPVIETGRLVVYGNANNDDYLDDRDVNFIEDIVNGVTVWDREENPFADTNTDGVIDNKDVELLKKFIKKESATMYYYDYAGTVQSIHYPITGNLSVIYNYGLDASIILGCYDRVVAAGNNVITTISNTETRYPGLKDMINLRDPVGDPEDLMQAGKDHNVKAIFGIGESYVTTIQDKLKAANSDIDVITINTSGYKGMSCDYLGGIITLGVMFGCEENAYKYIKSVDNILGYLEDKLADAPNYTYVAAHNPSNASTVSIRTTSSNGSVAGNIHTINMLPLTDLFGGKQASTGPTANIEDIAAKMDPDVIIISTWAMITDSMTYAEAQNMFENMASYLQICDAYKDKKIFCATFESYGTYSGIAALPLLAAYIWPDLVDEDYGWKTLQEYYDTYTMLDVDVKKVGCFAPHKL